MLAHCIHLRDGKRRLIRGGVAARISSKIRPQDPRGGAARIAAPQGVVEMEVMDSTEVSFVEPQSVPSRISVVLFEEAKVGGTHRLQFPRVDQDLRLLAGVAKPASVTVCEDSHVSPVVEGTLSSPDLAGKLFPVIPAGLLLVSHVDPVGLYGMKSPSDLEPVSPDGPYTGPVGSFGTLPQFSPGPAGPVGLRKTGGPVGPHGTLSPFISDPAGPVGPSDYVGPVGLCGTLSPSASELAILVDPGGMFPSSDDGPGLCPIGLTRGLSPAAVAPLPAEGGPTITLLPVEGLKKNYAVIGEENIAGYDAWSDPDVARTLAVIAMDILRMTIQ